MSGSCMFIELQHFAFSDDVGGVGQHSQHLHVG